MGRERRTASPGDGWFRRLIPAGGYALTQAFLQSGVTYKAVVTTGAKDSVGNPLAQQYKWFFTVR
jgi:hypothetical protein